MLRSTALTSIGAPSIVSTLKHDPCGGYVPGSAVAWSRIRGRDKTAAAESASKRRRTRRRIPAHRLTGSPAHGVRRARYEFRTPTPPHAVQPVGRRQQDRQSDSACEATRYAGGRDDRSW